MVVKSNSVKDTGKFANKLAKKFFKTGGVIALIGELGAGKTIFAQYFAKGLGIKEKIISPTFVLMRQHVIPDHSPSLIVIPESRAGRESSQTMDPPIKLEDDSGQLEDDRGKVRNDRGGKIFYHLDLYRLENENDFEGLGLEEIFEDENAIILIEWADKIFDKLPKKTIKITFEKTSDESRKILAEEI